MADFPRLSELIQRYLDGRTTAEEWQELNEALATDPRAADCFWAAAELDSLLERRFQEEPHREAFENRLTIWRKREAVRRQTAWLVAASLLLFVGGATLWQLQQRNFPRYDLLSGRVVVEGSPSDRIIEGAPVTVMGESSAVIRLSDGSQARLDPESEVIVRDGASTARQVVELRSGSGSFQVPKGKRPLRVETAVGSVTSADTEFFIDFLCSSTEGDDDVRTLPTSIAALVVSVAAGIVQVDVQDQRFTLSTGESRVFAAAPNEGKKKEGPLPLPSGDLLGFEINGKTVALERVFPGIRSALLLTDEQKRQIIRAQNETVQSEAVRTAGAALKGTPEAKEEEKTKAKEVVAAARKQLFEKMAAIITADQKALVKKLNTAATEAQATVSERFRSEQKKAKEDKAKADEMQQKMREPLLAEFKLRAAKILTAEQLAALENGIEEQKAADERAKNDPKKAKIKKP